MIPVVHGIITIIIIIIIIFIVNCYKYCKNIPLSIHLCTLFTVRIAQLYTINKTRQKVFFIQNKANCKYSLSLQWTLCIRMYNTIQSTTCKTLSDSINPESVRSFLFANVESFSAIFRFIYT